MAIDKSGHLWRGENHQDLAELIRTAGEDSYPIDHYRELICPSCAGQTFHLLVEDAEGCARADCVTCRAQIPVADSADFLDEAELIECECPCGGDTFAASLGFAMSRTRNEVRWITLGLRCLTDGTMGVYADWKIDYAPTAHLLAPETTFRPPAF